MEPAATMADHDGPISVVDIVDRLGALGHMVDEDDLIGSLVDDHGFWWLAGYLVLPRHILDGRVLTHRVTPDEIADSFLEIDIDLDLLILDDSDVFATPRGPVRSVFRRRRHILEGPEGWLGKRAGELLAIRWTGRGSLDVRPARGA